MKAVDDINVIPEEVQNCIESLRGKIKINQNPLNDYDLSDRIQFGKSDDKKILKLSDVLEEYKGESNVLDELIESFTSIKEKTKLRKLIFKTRRMPFNDVCTKIEAESSTYYTVYQVVFQLLYENYVGQREWSKKHFDDYWKEQGDEEQLHSSYRSFLDILFEIDYTNLSGFYFHDLSLENCVEKNYAIESEFLPDWIEEWISIKQSKRMTFISNLGFNGLESPIVKLRQSATSEDYDPVTVIGHYSEAKGNSHVIWNTVKWLSSFSSQLVTKNIELIKQINNDIDLPQSNLESIIIPVLSSLNKNGIRKYTLQSVPVNTDLFILTDGEEFAYSIYSAMKKEDENCLIIDSGIGNKSTHFNAKEIQLNESIDTDQLEQNSKLWDEPFYRKWEFHSSCPIFIFNGKEIPYERSFNGISVNKFTSDLKVENDGKYYVSSILKQDILNNLPSSFPDDMLSNLKEWHYRTLQNEALLDEDSFDYKEDIDRLLQDRLGISEEDQKRESGNAKTHAIYFLDENGFDVSKANNAGAALTNIIDPDGNKVDCIVRSAKGGLLYLDKEHWDMLENNLMYLIVIYPGNSPRMFKNRLELLEEELAENILFRVPNNKHTSEIDGVFDALESESHLILVTSEKMKERLFSKLVQKKKFSKEDNVAVGGDDFTF